MSLTPTSDMPTQLPYGCRIGAILAREDPRDAVVMKTGSTCTDISQLPPGSVIGTSSIRRSAQLTRAYPHLKFEDVRGNMEAVLPTLCISEAYILTLFIEEPASANSTTQKSPTPASFSPLLDFSVSVSAHESRNISPHLSLSTL